MLSRIARRGYHKVVVEHFNNPKNIGKLDPKDPNVGTGLVGAPACFHKDTLIATEDGSHTIGDLYPNTNNGTNIIHVTSFNLQTSVFETRPARVVYSGKKKMDILTISTGETIIVTPDHSFLVHAPSDGNYVYKENSIITEQDRLVSFCMKKEENVSIISREYYGEDDCYTLQVEVNNNYCIVTHDNVGIVVKNCGDVIKIQIKVDENDTIVDSKCKVFGCLAGNVRISTPDGYKKIRDCNVGDEIWAWNGEKIVKNEIEQIYVHYVPSDELMYLQFEGSSYFKFVCTKSHIWWKANDTPVEAETLNVGDECFHMTENELRSVNNIGRKSEELKNKNSLRMKELNKTLDRSKLPQSKKGYIPKNPEQARLNRSNGLKKVWQTEEYRKNWQEGMNKINWSNRPTKLEQKFIELFNENNIDVTYCGNNSVWINGCNPDFIVNGQNKVIEVFTSDMPDFMQNRKTDEWKIPKIKKFENAGYKCLFLDIKHIESAIHDVQVFIHNGLKVIRKETELTHNLLRDIEKNEEGLYKVYDIKCKEGANVFFVGRIASHNCASAFANTSLASDIIKGKKIDEVVQITNMDLAKATHSNQIKLHCSALAADAIKAAVNDIKKKRSEA